jgi:hypothetical protein
MLFLAILIALQPVGALGGPQSGCQGQVWWAIEAGLGEDSDLERTVSFLIAEQLPFKTGDLADEAYETRVKGYVSNGIRPGCAIYVAEWLPVKESDIMCFPFATRTHEVTSIDFDANNAFIGLTCSSGNVKMSCEDAETLGGPGARWPIEPGQETEGPFGFPLPPRTECAAVRNLN